MKHMLMDPAFPDLVAAAAAAERERSCTGRATPRSPSRKTLRTRS